MLYILIVVVVTQMYIVIKTPLHVYIEWLGFIMCKWTSLVGQRLKHLPAMQETWVQSLGWEDPMENGKATHCSYSDLEKSMDCIVHGSQRAGHE